MKKRSILSGRQKYMKPPIMADTSAWIEYFRGNNTIISIIEDALDEDRVYIAGPILSELIQGVRTDNEYDLLMSCIGAIPCIDCEYGDWINAGSSSRSLRKKGTTIPLTDVLISTLAIRYDMKVLTLDKHFIGIEDVKLLEI